MAHSHSLLPSLLYLYLLTLPLNHLSHQTSTSLSSASIHSWRRPATYCLTVSRHTTANSITTSTINDHSLVSKPRSQHGSQSERRRMRHERRASRHYYPRTSGSDCSNCQANQAGWRQCLTPNRLNNTRDKWMDLRGQ